jgi:hypothetical protein
MKTTKMGPRCPATSAVGSRYSLSIIKDSALNNSFLKFEVRTVLKKSEK